jgi:pimeloyl-ACP methyl ester carboxylesterase
MTLMISVLIGVATMILLLLLLNRRLRQSLTAPREPILQSLAERGLSGQAIRIPTQRNRMLDGWLLAGQPNQGLVVITHGWGANRELMLPLARPLQAAGFSVLLFDARNHGTSDSDSFSSMPRFAEDIDATLAWLKTQPAFRHERIALIGHSVGAAATLLAASRRADISAVVSLAAFAHPDGMMRRWLKEKGLPFFPLGWYVLNYVQWVIGARFDSIAPLNTIQTIRCPILLMHGSEDTTVPPEDAKALFDRRPHHEVILRILPGEHDASDKIDQHIDELSGFLKQHLVPKQVN